MSYSKNQEVRQKEWRKKQVAFPKENGVYKGNPYEQILPKNDWLFNIYPEIREKVKEYFINNNFKPHSGVNNLKSSFAACFNHLFPIRNNKEVVLSIAKTICEGVFEIENISKIPIDTDETLGYIAFEVTSANDLLKEGFPTRGVNCTSVDALILAQDKKKKKILIPIEWKYTEHYGNEDKSEGVSGIVRLYKYSDLIDKSKQIKIKRIRPKSFNEPMYLKERDYKNSIYFFEPFYQLMRQTLWAEQIIKYKNNEIIQADDFLHAHIIPTENVELLKSDLKTNRRRKGYYKSNGQQDNLGNTWKSYLKDPKKYRTFSPKELFKKIKEQDKNDNIKLFDYLHERYW